MSLWYDETFRDNTRLGLRVTRTLYSGKSDYQKVEIFETEAFGRVLAIDGVFMTSERDEFLYHEMLVHPAMTTAKQAKRVLVIGGGDGGTVREVLRHKSADSVLMIEIDQQVVEACKEHLPTIGSAWTDPRLEVRFADGIDYVKTSNDPPFDVILIDGTDPIGPGEVLFDIDFYRGCKRMLAPHGVLALQSETPLLFEEAFFETQRKLKTLFEHVHPYFGPVPIYASGYWSWTWASDAANPIDADASRVEQISAGTRYYNSDIHRSAFALPNYVREKL